MSIVNASNTVLIVDDNDVVREMLALLLALDDWSVIQAGSGAEALDILKTTQCRAIITDQRMPVMTGIELGHVVCSLFPASENRPILILISGVLAKDELQVAGEFFDIAFTKPVKSRKLHEAILAFSEEPA